MNTATITKRETKADREKAERAEACKTLREIAKLDKGSRVYTMVTERVRGGSTRYVRVLVAMVRGESAEIEEITNLVARATGSSLDRDGRGIRVGGYGFDAGHHVIYHLSAEMFEGDRSGYALRHERL